MSIILGLDLSLTSAGIAILRDGQPIAIRSVGHGSVDGKSYRHRSNRIVSQVRAVKQAIGPICAHHGSEMCARHRDAPCDGRVIDLAVIEGPLHHGPQQAYEWDRAQLWGGVYSQLLAWKIPTAVINPMTLKLWFTGAGNADKRRMLDTARLIFREPVSNHDQADALACALAGVHQVGGPLPVKFQPKSRQIDALAKVEWPQEVSCPSHI